MNWPQLKSSSLDSLNSMFVEINKCSPVLVLPYVCYGLRETDAVEKLLSDYQI